MIQQNYKNIAAWPIKVNMISYPEICQQRDIPLQFARALSRQALVTYVAEAI